MIIFSRQKKRTNAFSIDKNKAR